MVSRDGSRAELRGPPGSVPCRVLLAEDQQLSIVGVELQTVFPHLFGDADHAVV